ncbi:mitochondrial carrier domain-containing protein [Podospora didyma]|uniref:Mitochondrial carrier domain-containing protein n=1 Tax=Podospora didyma TaxID=330526 RepID=A0AAE0K1X7_9PEZI|nr:mitochondrial carrier domain-containing protein [Podospora didyma]
MVRASKLLPSIGHAVSGAGGTVISTLGTYPLDLVNTRLKVQRQLRADGAIGPSDGYGGVLDAFAAIYCKEGGLAAFSAGLGPDLAKSAADSFLFFLFYTWFRARRLHSKNHAALPYLSTLEELAVGAAAGACAKAFTTPVSNVVTRKQTASLLSSQGGDGGGRQKERRDNNDDDSTTTQEQEQEQQQPQGGERRRKREGGNMTFREIVADIRRERGVMGLWAGYSASLVLTLNPSFTFFLQQMLKRVLVDRQGWDDPGARTTFFLAAISKVVATSLTYPFQIAKARVQSSSSSSSTSSSNALLSGVRDMASDTIFATVLRIARAEGVRALYDGIGGELLKGFFNHGTTMLSKDIIHRFIVRLYLAILAALQRYPRIKFNLFRRTQELRQEYLLASPSSAVAMRRRGARYVENAYGSGQRVVAMILSSS